jgi:hypothetical protein
MNAPTPIVMDVNQHAALPFPQSLPEFQRLFPDDMACAAYLEKLRWQNGFVCPHCRVTGVPFYIATRPGVLTCRKCRRQTGLTVGTVMERSHTTRRCPLGFGPPTWSPAKLPACRRVIALQNRARRLVRNASSQPARLNFPRREPLVVSRCMALIAMWRRTARLWGPLPNRVLS